MTAAALKSRQIAVCAERIADPRVRARFVELLAQAAAAHSAATSMRREAWALYRDATGTGAAP
jgi:predicted hotdog family 3-hydroxylacyl-ACP dehydratase